jgi:ABC-type transport system involved in cytochrome bd biosynthesis fused ATPase/permease subunit
LKDTTLFSFGSSVENSFVAIDARTVKNEFMRIPSEWNKILAFTRRLAWEAQIMIMDWGKSIESGGHKELMKKGGPYAGLFELQARSYIG